MKKEKDASFGVIPVRLHFGQWEVLLIHQISNLRGDSYWIIPKGHQENDESPIETALRELREETGLVPDQLDTSRSFDLAYNFRYGEVRIEKTVQFFIGYIAVDAPITLQANEVKEAQWCTEAVAYKRITHKNARAVLRNVYRYLKNNKPTQT